MKVNYIRVRPHPGGKVNISLIVDGDLTEVCRLANEAMEKPYEVELHPVRKKRSLDANAYYHVLLDRLSAALHQKRELLHEQMLQDYGVTKMKDGKMVGFALREDIDPHEVSPYTGVIGEEFHGEERYVQYRVLKGSSEMNSVEFTHLLRGLQAECKDLGIETMTDNELKRLKGYEET